MDLIAVAKLVVVNHEQKKLLLLRRSASDSRRPGQWDLPGGQVEEGELLEEGAVRECREETGLVVDPKDLKLFMTLNGTVNEGRIWVNWLFFAVHTSTDSVQLSNEHDASQWFYLADALGSLRYERHIQALQCIGDDGLLGSWIK